MSSNLFIVALGLWGSLFAADPAVIDGAAEGGFAVLRSGWLRPAELERLCREGVREILVLDGTARERECRWREARCPDLRVRANPLQRAGEPLSAGFLEAFDQWVDEAAAADRKILFRCRHGWHRAGRLAAYYRMRHQGMGAEAASREMNQVGRMMWRHSYLEPQVRALADYIAGRACSVAEEFCVTPDGAGDGAEFAEDVCRPESSGGSRPSASAM